MEILPSLPNQSDYTLLAEHQAQTPASFYNGPPVLYLVSRHSTLLARQSDFNSIPAFTRLAGIESQAVNGHDNGTDTTARESDVDITLPDIDIWVTSEKLILMRTSTSKAISIPYPSIALHAVSSSGLYLQLVSTQDQIQSDEDVESTVEITLQPAVSEEASPRPVDALYQALSACADLHPDPQEQDAEDEDAELWHMPQVISGENAGLLYQVTASPAVNGQVALPPPMPGSSGWITAENVDEYFDEDGNWKGRVPTGEAALGPGAGTVRVRNPEDGEGEDGGGGGDDENKWQRTG